MCVYVEIRIVYKAFWNYVLKLMKNQSVKIVLFEINFRSE